MSYKTSITRITAAKTARSRQTTSYQYPTGEGTVVTGSTINASSAIYLDVTAPGSARTITPVSGEGGGATITSITYLDADNLPTNANAVNTTGGNILIVGTGFTSPSRVFVNNVQVTNTYINSSAIRATLSSSSTGNVGLYLFSSANTGGALSSNAVRFSGVPVWVTGTSVSSFNNLPANIQLEATGDSTLTYSLKSGSGSLPNGISLLSTGYLTGTATGYTVDTTVQFTLIVSDSENQSTQQTFNYSVLLGDTYFNQTTMLLNADQGNAFVKDYSINDFQVNVAGGAGPSRFTPFSANGYSAYFDGSGDYLSVPDNVQWDYGTGDFTIECWVNFNSVSSIQTIVTNYLNSSIGWGLQWRSDTGIWNFSNGDSQLLTFSNTPTIGSWNHIAVSRSGTSLRMFLNGTQVASSTNSTSFTGSTNPVTIGCLLGGSSGIQFVNGYISNLRIVKGTAVYTANFTPATTSLTTVANTSLLTLRDSVLADDSPYNFTITRNGDVRLTQFSPFKAYTLTPNSYSVYFDGSTDYLNITDSTGVGAWTLEFWIYLYSAPASNTPIISQGSTDNSGGWLMYMNTSRLLFMYSNGNLCTANTAVPLNEWSHVAYVSGSNNSLKIFVNGTDVGTGSYTTQTFTNTPITLNRGYGGILNGMSMLLSNFRLVKGTDLYTENFTPSTTALTAIANTSILTCQSTTIIDSNTTPKTITVFGNPNVSAANPFYETVSTISNYSYDPTINGASAYFDGTGDYLFVNSAPTSNLKFGTNDFTIESWVYPLTRANVGLVQISNVAGGLYNGTINTTALAIVSNKAVVRANGTTYTSTSTDITADAWTHFALARSANVSRLYVNGRLDTTIGSSGNITDSTNYTGSNVVIGGYATTSFLSNAYMSSLRIVNGNAVYTGTSFIPPTQPVAVVTNTSLLPFQTTLGSNSAQFVDESINSFVITRAGNANQGSFSPLVPTSWSAYFDGTGDYLTLPAGSTWHFSTGDFTIEFWMYPSGTSGSYARFFQTADGDVYAGISISRDNAANNLLISLSSNGSFYNISNGQAAFAYDLDTWTHVSLVRNGNNFRVYKNGVQTAFSATSSAAIYYSAAHVPVIGGQTGGRNFSGYISNFRIVKGTAVYTANFTPATSSLTAVANTSLLTLQSPTMQDNSVNNFTITRNGDTRITPFGPFVPQTVTPDSYSYYFSGTADYISTANANLAFGTGDFTVETWVYNRFGSNNGICQISNVQYGLSNTSTNTVALGLVSNKVVVRANNTVYTSTGTTISANTWYHLALTRASNIVKLYIDGTLDTTIGSSGSITDATNYTGTNLAVGGYLTTSVLANAYISNFRTVKGSAVYLENFTPSVGPLTAVANTVVLTAQSTTIVDTASVNTFTGNGNVSPRVFNPFGTTATYGVDYSPTEHGGSAYFDGTGDLLTTSGDPLLAFGTGDFTMEYWVYPLTPSTAFSGWLQIVKASDFTLFLQTNAGAARFLDFNGTTSNFTIAAGTLREGWNHLAGVRQSGVMKLFLNGTLVGSAANTYNYAGNWSVKVGEGGQAGYVSGVKVTKGTALYTGNFVPPLAPLLPTANTSILMNFTNSGVTDSAYRATYETVGDARLVNNVYKWNSGSYYFDGTGDYVLTRSVGTDIFTFGTGDFTIEMWIYFNSTSQATFYDQRPTSTNGLYPLLYIGTSALLYYNVNNAERIIGTTTITTGQWYHLALARTGSSTKMFLNGNQEGSTYTDTNNYLSGANRPILGSPGFTIGSTWFNGYIDDLRVTKGYARYTANFSPPEAAFPDL